MSINPARPSVLVVDDDLVVRALVTGWFRRQGYRVLACDTAAAARSLLVGEAAGVDVLVVDQNLGDGLGTELIASVPPRPTLVMSGDERAAVPVPPHAAFVAKPFSAFDLDMGLDRARAWAGDQRRTVPEATVLRR
jgi:DNA-binding response OmpR family regulator